MVSSHRKGSTPEKIVFNCFYYISILWPPQTECLRRVCIVGVCCWCLLCFYTAYLVLTKYCREVDANMDGIPDKYQHGT